MSATVSFRPWLQLLTAALTVLAAANSTPAPAAASPTWLQPRIVTAPADSGAETLAPEDIAWLKRATFGIDSASLERYRQLGRKAYLEQALGGGDDTLPAAVQQLIASYPVSQTSTSELVQDYVASLRKIKDMPDGDAKLAAKKALRRNARELGRQAQQIELLRATYGGDQLKEQMIWFWLNHFSIYAAKGGVHLVAADYEENVIRPHALGNFRELVMATLESPAMLQFLDNAKNVTDKTNENYARELMELHTLGVGSGYSQQDVQQLALILTGAGIAPRGERMAGRFAGMRPGFVRHGLFVFNPNKHDFSDKMFLGQRIRGSGYGEIEQAVDLIVRQPACARFVSQQLAEYFVADQPPPALVDAMAATFQRSHGDIAAVLRTLFDSPELTAHAGGKFKDPTQFVVSAMRLAYDGQAIGNAVPLANWLAYLGEPVFGRITPDGWPMDAASWSSSGQMNKRFEIAGAIGSGRSPLFSVSKDDAEDQGQASRPLPKQDAQPPKLDGPVYHRTIEPFLSASTRAALGKANSPAEWNTFLLSSPEFNYR